MFRYDLGVSGFAAVYGEGFILCSDKCSSFLLLSKRVVIILRIK